MIDWGRHVSVLKMMNQTRNASMGWIKDRKSNGFTEEECRNVAFFMIDEELIEERAKTMTKALYDRLITDVYAEEAPHGE